MKFNIDPPPSKRQLQKLNIELKKLELLTKQRELEKTIADSAERRILKLTGNVTDSSVASLARGLGDLCARSLDPITVQIMSPGGSVLPGFALYDAMLEARAHGVHLTTVGVGYTASMAGVLVQAGDVRVLSENSYFHIHEVSSSHTGNVNTMKDAAKFAETLWHHLSDILAARSSFSAEELRDKVERKDWWMGADEALRHGFIDEVR